MRHKKTRSQIEPHRVPGSRQHTPYSEASNANHCMVQEIGFFLVFAVAPGFLFTVTVTVSTTVLVTDSDAA